MMDKKKIIILGLIIIILASSVILISSQNNTKDLNNYPAKNSTSGNISNEEIQNNSGSYKTIELIKSGNLNPMNLKKSISAGFSTGNENKISTNKSNDGSGIEVIDIGEPGRYGGPGYNNVSLHDFEPELIIGDDNSDYLHHWTWGRGCVTLKPINLDSLIFIPIVDKPVIDFDSNDPVYVNEVFENSPELDSEDATPILEESDLNETF